MGRSIEQLRLGLRHGRTGIRHDDVLRLRRSRASYTVVLTVTDDAGNKASTSKKVAIIIPTP
ncbi:MAG: hypothetical protein MZU95_03105 [Desulfomicrobium escambiense]|nr:hypothetical protein [Desulfomicrobium escambiense]